MQSRKTENAAMALRQSFGDRKLPDITRKITACVACRKLKIKCHMSDSKPPCSRCKSRGLSCTVNKSLQMLLEGDATWKESIEDRLEKLEEAMADRPSKPTTSTDTESVTQSRILSTATKRNELNISQIPQGLESPNTLTLNLSCGLGSFPASSMMNLTFTGDRTYVGHGLDLISCGLISLETAESLFSYYNENLEPLMHNVLEDNATLATTRRESSLLTTSICTVAAFCTGSGSYQSCLKYFKREVSDKVFASEYSFNDVRALCIGAFWVNEISSALNGLAVRIATELDLHRCITKMPHTKRECYDRTRLYFLVYLCDHHCSLIHGRPPLTRDFSSLKSPEFFLQTRFWTTRDLNLVSQVELWSISSNVFSLFGADIENEIATQRSTELHRLSTAYDEWCNKWLEVFKLQRNPTNFSPWVFDLYFHSSKLYLFSHVFRGHAQRDASLTADKDDTTTTFAQSAVESALSIIRCIVDTKEAPLQLEKLPLYFATMIAFASVYLVQVLSQQKIPSQAKKEEIYGYLQQLVGVLNTSLVDHPIHPLMSISKSLEIATTAQPHSGLDQTEIEHENDIDFSIFLNEGMNLGYLTGQDEWPAFIGG